MRAVDIVLLSAAALIGLLTLALTPWTTPWWIAVIIASAILIAASAHIAGWKHVNTWAPWILIIGAPVIGALWLYLAKEQKLPGFTSYAVIRLYDTPEFRRRYVFEFVSSDGAKVSFYLSASSIFTFSATDLRGEAYPLEVKLGDGGIPIDQFVVLFCEIGIAKNSTTMRVLVNEKEVARRDLAFPLILGKMDWKPGTLGAPATGTNQGGVFLLSEIGIYPRTMTSEEVHGLVENAASSYKQVIPVFDGSQNLGGAPQGQGGKGGSGEIFGSGGTIIGGKGGNVGAGGVGRGGDGGGGVIHGDGGTIIGGEGGSVDGTNIWYPPASSGYIQHLESQGQTPDFGVQQPGEGGATGGWLQRQAVVAKIREEYFRKKGQPAKIQSSKIGDVPLDYINEKLKEEGYPWRARIEKKYWYLYYVPGTN